jgi:hypothetical protein
MRAIPRRCLIVICFVGMFCSSEAWADRSLARPSKQAAREHLDHGNVLYKEAKWEEAIGEYEAGAKIEPAPVFDYNLGQCHRKRGEYQAALHYYDRFVTNGQPEGEVLAAVQAFMAEMRAQLANRAQTMPPTDAEPSKSRDVEPSKSREQVPRINTRRSVAEPAPEPPRAEAGSARVDSPESSNWLGWTTIGVGVAAVGVSGYLFLRASSMNDASDSEPDTRARNALRDGARTRTLVGAATGIAGVALATTGIVLLVTRHAHQRRDAGSLSLSVAGHGIVVFGQF